MNIRKSIDYSEMYAALDRIMEAQMSQMELYCEIGKAVCQRREKGAAVAAAAYLHKQYPDVQGFSPRNLRRMRDFYRIYENDPQLLSLALQLGWTQNVVILEADLPMELRGWYLKAVKRFGWSKNELIAKIASNAYGEIVLTIDEKLCYTLDQEKPKNMKKHFDFRIHHLLKQFSIWWITEKGGIHRRYTMLWQIFTAIRIAFMRC